jgi:hypothetical protein
MSCWHGARLASELPGMVQDAKGVPLSPQRAARCAMMSRASRRRCRRHDRSRAHGEADVPRRRARRTARDCWSATITAITRSTIRKFRMRNTIGSWSSCARSRASIPSCSPPDSPTQRVGAAPVAAFGAVRHRIAMLSLDNAFSEEEVRDFDRRIRERLAAAMVPMRYSAEPKLDGLAISARYENGLVRAGRDPRRRRDRRGHHAESATIKALPLKLRGRRCRRCSRCAARCSCLWRASSASTKRRWRAARRARQSAQCGGRQPAATRSAHDRGAAARSVHLRHRQSSRARRTAAEHSQTAQGAARAGVSRSARNPRWSSPSRAVWSTTATWARCAPSCPTRSTASSTKSTMSSCSAAGLRVARAALGDRP